MRFYSTDVPPEGVVETCIATAGTMPSGAHHQPWFFVMVRDAGLKMQIQELVEEEERVNYERRMRKSWIEDLSVMTGENADPRLRSVDNSAPKKPYLSQAPILIALFKQSHSIGPDGVTLLEQGNQDGRLAQIRLLRRRIVCTPQTRVRILPRHNTQVFDPRFAHPPFVVDPLLLLHQLLDLHLQPSVPVHDKEPRLMISTSRHRACCGNASLYDTFWR